MKRNKIFYWTTTALVALPMLASGVMYLTRQPAITEGFGKIGLPGYLIAILGVAKLAGALALLAPVWEQVKEWAYAGFGFVFIGAVWTHVATGTPWIAPLVFLALLAASYFFRLRVR